MKTKLLTSFLLLILATPESFAVDPGRRGESVRRGNSNRGGSARTAPRNNNRRGTRTARTSRRNERRTTRTAPRNSRRVERSTPRRSSRRNVERRRSNRRTTRTAPRNTTRRDRGRVSRRDNRGPIVRRDRRANRRGRVNTPRRYRPNRSHYGTRNYHRPYGYRHRNYSRYNHRPYSRINRSHRRWGRPYGYYSYLRSNYRTHLYLNWILAPSSRINGYFYVNNYPYYVHNGYRHRYSNLETCNYQLVDKYTHSVERTYWNQLCTTGYNSCAYERDRRNDREYSNRYFCAETFRDNGYNFSTPTYDYNDTEYYDSQQPDDQNYSDQSNEYRTDNDYGKECYDYDSQTGVCYDV